MRSRPELARLLTPRTTEFIPHTPTPRQAAFLLLSCKEAMFGGAAGGGKSDALLMAALQYVDVPGYAALLLRRTFADLALPKALMDRAGEWLAGTAARWSERDKTWTFPSGATITFGYLETERDKYRYQGAEFQFIGFDELTQFMSSQYTYLFSRLRRIVGVPVPLRMRSATNPGGVGHAWVKQRLIVEGRDHGRVFVPSRLEDNPHVDQEAYEASLAELPPLERAQLRNGDWDAEEVGGWFDRRRIPLVDPSAVPPLRRAVRFWDCAATAPSTANPDPDWTVGVRVGEVQGQAGVCVVEDIARCRLDPADVEAFIKATAEADGKGVEQWFEQEPGSSGKQVIDHWARHVLRGYPVFGLRSTGSKTDRAKPLVGAVSRGEWRVVASRNVLAYLDVLEGFPLALHDDDVDASSGSYTVLTGQGRTGAAREARTPSAVARALGLGTGAHR